MYILGENAFNNVGLKEKIENENVQFLKKRFESKLAEQGLKMSHEHQDRQLLIKY